MTNPKIQIDEEIRDMNAEEIAHLESQRADNDALKTGETNNAIAKATAKAALLDRLGISAQEAELLLS